MSNLLESVLDSQQIMVDAAIKKAGYDKTIQAQIVSCQDATIGKYKCRFQDAIFYAYSNNSDVSYADKAYVYILVPGNDMSKEKTILGTTSKLGINYISQAQGDEAYDIIGTNCIINNEKFYLDTKYQDYNYVLYEASKGVNNTFLNIEALNQYLKQSSSLIVGATFKTLISPQKQYRGHYGIIYNLKFTDNTSNQEVIRSYTVDEDNMIDNPYRLAYPTRQYQIYEIDGPNFIEVDSIQIFNKDFPNSQGTNNEKLTSGDIEITNLEMSGAVRMSQSEINGVAISFYTPLGTFFTGMKGEREQKIITAQVRVKGKLASAAQNIPFYWGIENVGITPKSEYYNKYLGRGWKCLNESNIINYKREFINPQSFKQIIKEEQENKYYFKNFEVYVFNENTEESILATPEDIENKEEKIFCYFKPDVIEWVPYKDTYIFNKKFATVKNNKIKVAILYEGTVITKQINIQNLEAETILSIESNEGTQFYYDIGHPTLTCKVKKKARDSEEETEQPQENYEFSWAYEDSQGVFSQLPETNALNQEYDNLWNSEKEFSIVRNNKTIELEMGLNSLNQKIENGEKFPNKQKDTLEQLNTLISDFDYIQRVQKNKIYDVQINKITKFGIFKCSVYDKNNNIYLGTTSITLKNTLEGENLYSLVINNGSEVFQYNENGVAPNNKSLDVPQQIQALSFTVYDNLGKPIDNSIILNDNKCKVRWQVPVKDTMLIDKQRQKEDSGFVGPSLDGGYYNCYDNISNLIYDIQSKYDIKKQRNQIKLTVDYKGMNLTAETNFTFAKQGQPGTNGTQFLVKIVPNTEMNNPPLWPMITKINGKYYLNYGVGNSDNQTEVGQSGAQLFEAQLWRSGNLIWKGFSADNSIDGITKPVMVNWEILTNVYTNNITDDSLFKIEDQDSGKGLISFNGFDSSELKNPKNAYANIIKCSITYKEDDEQAKTYYGTIPITIAWVKDENFEVYLEDYTGWRYAIYTSDGVLPQYDNSRPFEFKIKKKIDNVWEDISLVEGQQKVYFGESNGEENNKQIFAPFSVGSYKSTKDGSEKSIKLIEVLTSSVYRDKDKYKDNQWEARPVSRYDGVCVNSAIVCPYYQKIKNENDELQNDLVGIISVPIHFLLNKYGLSNINAWDGNSVQVDDEGGFILSPQMGAGTKNTNNQFTGVLMGQVRNAGKSNSDIGLLGYFKGDRTFFLNSKNGSALFGKTGKGQVIVDPTEAGGNNAYIYSGNFWKDSNYDAETGLPKNYTYRNDNTFQPNNNVNIIKNVGQGMIINLSKPEIYFGSGKFCVTDEGHIHAAGGGDIAGWVVSDQALTSKDEEGSLTLNSNGSIYSNNHNTFSNSHNGFFLSQQGLSIGSKVKIDNQGKMELGNGAWNGSGRHWTINGVGDEEQDKEIQLYNDDGTEKKDKKGNLIKEKKKRSFITYGNDTYFIPAGHNHTSDVYIGTDGISLGKSFSIDSSGNLISRSGYIGGWKINETTLKAGNIELNSNGSIKGGRTEGGNNYTWQIAQNGQTKFNYITANTGGSIGGWEIASNNLKSSNGDMILYSNGTIQGKGWQIFANGKTTGMEVTGATINISGGGITSSGGYIGTDGGHLGANGSSGSINSSAPLIWDKTKVTMQNGAEIGEFTIKNNHISGNNGLLIKDSGGDSPGDGIKGGSQIDANLFTGTFRGTFQVGEGQNYLTLKAEYFKNSGKLTFSDDSYLEIKNGLVVYVHPGKNAKYE